jgi:hypothetical protein
MARPIRIEFEGALYHAPTPSAYRVELISLPCRWMIGSLPQEKRNEAMLVAWLGAVALSWIRICVSREWHVISCVTDSVSSSRANLPPGPFHSQEPQEPARTRKNPGSGLAK